jgi:hypothetical protein
LNAGEKGRLHCKRFVVIACCQLGYAHLPFERGVYSIQLVYLLTARQGGIGQTLPWSRSHAESRCYPSQDTQASFL